MKTIHTTTIRFPEITLTPRHAHKLRGYFGNLFREHSPLLHNHWEDGTPQYRYPLVQYKVVNQVPTLVGFEEGAQLLVSLFLNIEQLQLEGKTYPVYSKNIESRQWSIGVGKELYAYRFHTLWMALNQQNYHVYQQEHEEAKQQKLKRIAVSNILAYYKAMDLHLQPHERILMHLQAQEKSTHFKDQKMLAFTGEFTTNALLPDLMGIGKAVSRGFGTVQRIA